MKATIAHIEALILIINKLTNNPHEPYTKTGARRKVNIGNYHLSQAYGGYCLNRMANNAGGVNDVFYCGHISKKDLASRMRAFISGLDLKVRQ